MGIVKKLLFPFYNKKTHHFLTEKWWFRALNTIFIFVFIASIPLIWFSHVDGVYNRCIGLWEARGYGDLSAKIEGIKICNEIARESWSEATWTAIIFPLVVAFFVQLLFFKVVIDYIVLGNKK